MVGIPCLKGLSGTHRQHLGLFYCSRWHLHCKLECRPSVLSLPLALRVKVLLIYSSLWTTIHFDSYDHCTAPISRHAHGYLSYDTSFYILPKGLSYWFLEVEGYGNWVMPGFRDLFEVNMGGWARHGWEYHVFI